MERALYGVYALVFVSEIERVRFLIRQQLWSILQSVFTQVASYTNSLEQKKAFTLEKSSTPTGFVWDTNMAAVFIILGHQNERREVMWKRSIFMAGILTRIVLHVRKPWQFFPRVLGTYDYLDIFFLLY